MESSSICGLYENTYGPYVSADNIRELSDHLLEEKKLTEPLDPSELNFELFNHFCSKNNIQQVVLIAGGPGSGKSYLFNEQGELGESLRNNDTLVLENCLGETLSKDSELVDKALENSRDVEMLLVYCPADLAMKRMIERVETGKGAYSLDKFVEWHSSIPEKALSLGSHYHEQNQKRIQENFFPGDCFRFKVFDNTESSERPPDLEQGWKEGQEALDFLETRLRDRDVRAEAKQAIDQLYLDRHKSGRPLNPDIIHCIDESHVLPTLPPLSSVEPPQSNPLAIKIEQDTTSISNQAENSQQSPNKQRSEQPTPNVAKQSRWQWIASYVCCGAPSPTKRGGIGD